MIYTLTLNPSIDYIVGIDNLETGKVNRNSYDKILPGGKGINVSIVLSNCGVKSCALGFVGGFSGEYIKKAVKKAGVKTDFVLLKNGISRINVKIKAEEETEINASGPEISDYDKSRLEKKLRKIKSGDFLVLAGSVPKGFGKDFYSNIMKSLPENLNVVVDAEGELLTNTLKYRPFLVKPNIFELEQIFGVKISHKAEIVKYAKELQNMGAKNVIVSMGGDGAVFLTEEGKCMFSPAPKGKVINTTGSGDSTVAGFLYSISKKMNFEDAFLFAVSCGSACAFSENLAEFHNVVKIFENIKENIEYFN